MSKEEKGVKEEKKKQQKKPVSSPPAAVEEKEGFKGIVRIAGKDVKGQVQLRKALRAVRGIGSTISVSIAHVIEQQLGISPTTRVGELGDEKIEKIDAILFNISNHSVPKYLFNHQKEFSDGTDKHAIMNDLLFISKQDLEREKKSFTWRGYRHAYGQKVRGQRTRNTGRTGMSVGVMRKAVLAAAQAQKDTGKKPAAAGEKPAEKK